MTDFDGDGKKDIAVWRPSDGTWNIIPSSNPGLPITQQWGWGPSADIPVPGDYDGDGKADYAVWRPSTGMWHIIPSSNPGVPITQQWGWGPSADIPVPGDYDGDGKTDYAVWRPSEGKWYIILSSNPGVPFTDQWGVPGDVPVPGDYDGDGKTDMAIFRNSDSSWCVKYSAGGTSQIFFGQPGDVPVPEDYDGDGKTDIAVYRPSNSVWYVQGSASGYSATQYGQWGDVPVPGDYDGDGHAEPAVFRPSEVVWYIRATSAGPYQQQFGVPGDLPVTRLYFGNLTPVPAIQFVNLTHPNLSPNFAVGDAFWIAMHGAPNQAVTLAQTSNGSTITSYMGNTDAYGNYNITGVEQTANIGSYTQVWSVGGVPAGSAISFMVGQLGTGGTVTTTNIGATPDGHILGLSILSIANGSATTYSATELDYAASLYYDAETRARLYEEGVAVRSGTASGFGLADGYMSAPATAWKDYDIQTDHYVTAYIPYGPFFVNYYYYADGSCDAYSSDCSFGPGGGFYYVTVASIYLGSTLAHQTNVPQDGSVPLVDNSAYNNFLSTVSPPPNSGITFSVDAWGKIIRDVAPILYIARSVWADQHPENPYIYPLPFLIDLIDDVQSKPKQGSGNDAERVRTYLLEDTYGRPWLNGAPVRVSEIFHYVGGSGPMPPPNNPTNPYETPWSYSAGEMVDGKFSDRYGFQASSQPPVWYWQFYWASGFTVPSDFTLFPIPGITDGSMPGLTGPVIPLIIKSKHTTASPVCADFASQGVLLSSDYIGINGDTGPATPPGCPRELGVY